MVVRIELNSQFQKIVNEEQKKKKKKRRSSLFCIQYKMCIAIYEFIICANFFVLPTLY